MGNEEGSERFKGDNFKCKVTRRFQRASDERFVLKIWITTYIGRLKYRRFACRCLRCSCRGPFWRRETRGRGGWLFKDFGNFDLWVLTLIEQVKFISALTRPINNYLNYRGRRRKEYWGFKEPVELDDDDARGREYFGTTRGEERWGGGRGGRWGRRRGGRGGVVRVWW